MTIALGCVEQLINFANCAAVGDLSGTHVIPGEHNDVAYYRLYFHRSYRTNAGFHW